MVLQCRIMIDVQVLEVGHLGEYDIRDTDIHLSLFSSNSVGEKDFVRIREGSY